LAGIKTTSTRARAQNAVSVLIRPGASSKTWAFLFPGLLFAAVVNHAASAETIRLDLLVMLHLAH
jgi:hypothetical protein